MKTTTTVLISTVLLCAASTTAQEAPATTSPQGPAPVVITQKDKKFSQSVVRARRGDTLVFRNADDFAHNLYSISPGAQFSSIMQKSKESTFVPLSKEGEFEVQCAFHPMMKLQVKVAK